MKEIEKKTLFGALFGYADSTRITQEENSVSKSGQKRKKNNDRINLSDKMGDVP